MSSAISYEVNQLGAGRWRRERPTMLEQAAFMPTPPRRRLHWVGVAVLLATLLPLAMLLTVILPPRGEAQGSSLSGYMGVGGSHALIAEAAPLLPTTVPQAAPPATSTPAPTPPTSNVAVHPTAPSDYNIMGPPSISVATIEVVLLQYNSPAVGNGQAFYDLGVKYGVDPAYMLAFYVHESAAGTAGAAVATKSVGNIICAGWSRCIGRFRAYDSYVQAAEDWYQLITGPLYVGAGLTTPEQITPRYAPDSDNNDSNGYAQTVERLVDGWRR